MIGTLWARVQAWLALLGVAVATLGAAYLAGRPDGRVARHAEAARNQQQQRRAGDATAREAERAGPAERLRRGDF